MAPSRTAVDVVGALSGGVLAACLAPQLYKMVRTRSAADLSYIWLAMYITGLLFMFLYLYWEEALVAWICILVEMGFAASMVALKVWYDNWGPNGRRAMRRAQREVALSNSLSFKSEVMVGFQDFLSGGSAPFPLMQHARTHRAQHLLLDCRLDPKQLHQQLKPGPDAWQQAAAGGSLQDSPKGSEGQEAAAHVALDLPGSEPNARQTAAASHAAAAAAPSGKLGDAAAGGSVLQEVGSMLHGALTSAGADVTRQSSERVRSLRRPKEGGEQEAQPDMLYMATDDGYATVIWYPDSSTFSVDLVAASEPATERMAAAARSFVAALSARYAGARVAATSIARVPEQD